MKPAALALAVAATISIPPTLSLADGRLLSDEQWRSDVRQAVGAILETHPAAFGRLRREDWLAESERLLAAIPGLSDQGVFVELAVLIGRLGDGHTRLTFERLDPDRRSVLEVGHRPRPFEGLGTLRFVSLPVRVGAFDDGVFVTGAVAEHRDLVGLEVLAFDETPVAAVLTEVAKASFADNASRALALVPYRLDLPELLHHRGLTRERESASLRLVDASGNERSVRLTGLAEPRPLVEDRWPPSPGEEALREGAKSCWTLPNESAAVVRVDEIEAFPPAPIAPFLARCLRAAEQAHSDRLIFDLRANFGGDASWNKAYVKALIASPFNRYGRLFVLVGRSTYSAAIKLALDLENLTEANFVGEPAGAPTSSAGDPKRFRLTHSGVDLRVSTRLHPSYLVGDSRDGFPVTLPAPLRSADYFAGLDSALAAALRFTARPSLAGQLRDLFDRGHPQEALLRYFNAVTEPDVDSAPLESDLLGLGSDFLAAGRLRDARFVFTLVAEYLSPSAADAHCGLGRALAAAGDREGAEKRFRRMRELDPGVLCVAGTG